VFIAFSKKHPDKLADLIKHEIHEHVRIYQRLILFIYRKGFILFSTKSY